MIALHIEGQQAVLLPKASISFEVYSNLLDLDFLNGAKSLSFSLPALPNAHIFGHPESLPNASHDLFKEKKATLNFAGEPIFTGVFKMSEANNKLYKGHFKFDLSEIVAFRDSSIRDLLGDTKHTFASQELDTLINYIDVSSNIVFPPVKMNDNIYNKWFFSFYVEPTDAKKGTFIPFLKLKWVLELLLNKIGYRILNTDWTSTAPDFDKITIWNNAELNCELTTEYRQLEVGGSFTGISYFEEYAITRTKLPVAFELKEHVPNMTLGNFINGIRKLFGIIPVFDFKFKTVKLLFLKDILDQEDYIDWTDKADPNYDIEANDYKGITFAFKRDDKDKRIKEQPKEADYERLGDVANLQELNLTLVSSKFGAVRFVKSENKFYRLGIYEGAWLPSWMELHDNILDYSQDGGGQKYETLFSPVPKSSILQFKGENGQIREGDDAGSLILKHQNIFNDTNGSVILTKSQYHRKNFLVNILQNAPDYIKLGQLSYVQDEDGVAWTRLRPTSMPLLEFETPETRPFQSQFNVDFAPRLFLYHGLQEQSDNPITFPYASSDAYAPKGTIISDFGLHWEGERGLLAYFFSKFLQIKKYGHYISYRLRLSINDLKNLDVLKKIRIREVSYFIKEIKAKISKDVGVTEAILVKIPTPALNLAEYEVEYYHDCGNTYDVEYYHDCEPTPVLQQFKVIVNQNFGGSCSKNGTNNVTQGDNFFTTCQAYRDTNLMFEIQSITINGVPIQITNRYVMPISILNIQEDKLVNITYVRETVVPQTVKVTVSIPSGGGTSPQLGTYEVLKGQNYTYVLNPSTGFELLSVAENGVPRSFTPAQTTFILYNVQTDITVVAQFKSNTAPPPNTFNVNVWAGTGGSSPQAGNNTVNKAANFTFTATPNTGYQISSVKVNGVPHTITTPSGESFTIVNVQANQVVEILFSPIPAQPTYTVTTSSANAGGSVTPASQTIPKGGKATYQVTVQNGKEIDTITQNATPLTLTANDRKGRAFEINDIQTNWNVVVTYRDITPVTVRVQVIADFGGGADPVGVFTIPYNGSFSTRIFANQQYEIQDITVNQVAQTITNRKERTVALTNIVVDTVIYATYRFITPTYTVTLDFEDNNATADKPKVSSVNQYGSYGAAITPRADFEIDKVWLYDDSAGLGSAIEQAVPNRLRFDASLFAIASSKTFKFSFRKRATRYNGFIRIFQNSPTDVIINRTFGGDFTKEGYFVGQTVQVTLIDQNSPFTMQLVPAVITALDNAKLYLAPMTLTASQAMYQGQSFMADIRNEATGFARFYFGY